jgi:hypothetical protein
MFFSARRSVARLLLSVSCALAPFGAAFAQIDVVTQRYDDARLGANLQETQLNASNVNAGAFGKLWSYTVSGSVYAQPLYVRNVTIPDQGTFNVLYVVTMNDIVYAFDADSANNTPLLSLDVTSEVPGSTPIPILDILGFNDNIIGNVGIESTPQIDLATNTMYVVARTREMDGNCGAPNPTFCQRMHALDITTLEEKPGSPVILGGSVACTPGAGGTACHDNGDGTGTLTFDPKWEDQRPSLALSNGRVFIAWSAHSDQGPYHGWVMAYDAATLQQTMIWSAAPDGTSFNGAGIWMGGRAPAVDASGNVYFVTGNGTWDGVDNFGESFVKFGPTPDAPLLDWFTPDNVEALNGSDADLGGSGPVLVPGTNLIVSGGKSGVFYVTRTDDLGHRSTNDMNIVQAIDNNIGSSGQQIKGGAIYWNRDGGLGPWMYVWSDDCNRFNAYLFNGTTFDDTPVSQSTMLSPCGSSGGVLTLSANGSTPGSGIVWASIPTSSDANSGVHPGTLRAFDADDLDTELWNSNQNQARDDAGNWPKFSAPIVVNGRVYLASFPSNGIGNAVVNVYGQLNLPPEFSMTATPPNPGTAPGGSVVYTIDITAQGSFTDTIHLDVDGLPAGATATFAENDLTPPATTTLTVETVPLTLPGQYTLHISGDTGSLQHAVDNGLYVTTAAPGAGIIGIDFIGGGTSLAATGSAGVISKPNWNEADGTSGSGLSLLDESATDTGATLTYAAGDTGTLGLADSGADFVMMDGYLDAAGDTGTVTVSNLPPYPGGYYVYVYSDVSTNEIALFTLSGDGGETESALLADPTGVTFSGTYVRADPNVTSNTGNYVVLFTSSTDFTLTFHSNQGDPNTALNGIQIVRGDRLFANGFD